MIYCIEDVYYIDWRGAVAISLFLIGIVVVMTIVVYFVDKED